MIGMTDHIKSVGMHTVITKRDLIIVPADMKNIFMDIDILGTTLDIIIKSTIVIKRTTNLDISSVTKDVRRIMYTILVFKHAIGFCII
jgi:hypothetical protein